jgi:hypothetical protein
MNPETRATFQAAMHAVNHLVKTCRKGGPLYAQNPRAVAQVSRTGKWLLNAIQRLYRELDARSDHAAP